MANLRGVAAIFERMAGDQPVEVAKAALMQANAQATVALVHATLDVAAAIREDRA
jgi:hypothetical protein